MSNNRVETRGSEATERPSQGSAGGHRPMVDLAHPSANRDFSSAIGSRGSTVTNPFEDGSINFSPNALYGAFQDKWSKFLNAQGTDNSGGDTAGNTQHRPTDGQVGQQVREPVRGGKPQNGGDARQKPTHDGPVVIDENPFPELDPTRERQNAKRDGDKTLGGTAQEKPVGYDNGLTPTAADRALAQNALAWNQDSFKGLFSDSQNQQISDIQNSLINGDFSAFKKGLQLAGQQPDGRHPGINDVLRGVELNVGRSLPDGITLQKEGDNVLAYTDTSNYALQVNTADGSTSVRRVTRDENGNVTVEPGEVEGKDAAAVFQGFSNHVTKGMAKSERELFGDPGDSNVKSGNGSVINPTLKPPVKAPNMPQEPSRPGQDSSDTSSKPSDASMPPIPKDLPETPNGNKDRQPNESTKSASSEYAY